MMCTLISVWNTGGAAEDAALFHSSRDAFACWVLYFQRIVAPSVCDGIWAKYLKVVILTYLKYLS